MTERATATLVSELVSAGYLERFKDGRRNRYRVDLSGGLRHPVVAGVSVGAVLAPLVLAVTPSDVGMVGAAGGVGGPGVAGMVDARAQNRIPVAR